MQINYDWLVIGAGPAGIAAVGKLIDYGVPPKRIAWCDPEFKVGDFGMLWENVPSNTKAKLFTRFLNASAAFNFSNCNQQLALLSCDPEQSCSLSVMAEALQRVTEQLTARVHTFQVRVQQLELSNRVWQIQLQSAPTVSTKQIVARQVILAIGAEPKILNYSNYEIIKLSDVFDTQHLAKQVTAEDRVAVFGSSHSAIIAIKNLLEHTQAEVINFYRNPLLFAVDLGDWILFDDTGLKATTAEWARENILGALPKRLKRFLAVPNEIEYHLPDCNKIVYTIGFETRHLHVSGMLKLTYNESTGIIAPGLFGIGIGFPEAKLDPLGNLEYRVGLWKFMEYLDKVLPIWLRYLP